MKDWYAWTNDPVQTAKNKAHPMVNTIFEMLDNKDYYGALIRNPDDPALKQIQDEIMFPVKQSIPFSIRNFQRQQEVTGEDKPWYDWVASPQFVGVTPVPQALARDEDTQAAIERKRRLPALRKKVRQEAAPARP